MIRQQPNHFPNSPQWHGNLPTMARKSSCNGTKVTLCFAISSHCSTSDKIVAGLFLVVACILVCHQRLSVHCWLACLLILSFLTRSKCSRFCSIATLPRRPSEKARPRTIATLPRTVARTNRHGFTQSFTSAIGFVSSWPSRCAYERQGCLALAIGFLPLPFLTFGHRDPRCSSTKSAGYLWCEPTKEGWTMQLFPGLRDQVIF